MKPFNLEEYLKNPNRKVVTRDGRNVTIHCTNYRTNQPIIAEIEGTNWSESFNKDGKWLHLEESPIDLFFKTEKHEGWINIYNYEEFHIASEPIYTEKKEAVMSRNPYYVATVKIEWEE